MLNNPTNKRYITRSYMNQINDIKCEIKHQEEMLEKLIVGITKQQEILELYYKEYQQLKRRDEKQYLMTFIRMRESMMKDIVRYEQNCQTDAEEYRVLKIYIDEYTDTLEEYGVEIVDCSVGEYFNPEIQKPIKRVRVAKEDDDNIIFKVFGSGYQWNGMILKKIEVSVGVYESL